MLFAEKNYSFSAKIMSAIILKTKTEIRKHSSVSDPVLDITATFLVSGMFSIFYSWISNGRKEPIDRISRTVSQLMTGALREVI